MRRTKGEPEALGDLVPRVLDDLGLGLDGSARILRVVKCWEQAVGSEVASHCRPTAFRDDTLEANVDSSVWCQQLRLRAPEILAALRRVLGEEAPLRLWFRVS